jgi:tRNA 2-thiouridine synthesizing protein A
MANGSISRRMSLSANRDPPRIKSGAGFRRDMREPHREISMAETTINLRGLKCPLPALRARKALSRLAADDILVVECTDPLTEIDIPNLVRETGDKLEQSGREGDVIVFRIRKS